ncbi:MAG: (d)CMP kinase [Propionibacteriaceae bacterium]|jgi:cytidylate kinase|nr:(d)CMP kinase [Propionibacteriaceae bacterium]
MIIAIDGPSGVGKSSTAKGVARALGLGYLDTGAMYRAVTVAFLDAGVEPSDTAAVIAATRSADIDISVDPDDFWVRVNGRDVTTEIREPYVSAKVSTVSTIAECRADLVKRQRDIIMAHADPGIVAEGRDITTVVAPDAPVRILMSASEAARLARRKQELGQKVDEAQLVDQVLRRDRDDSKLVNFTTAADGVISLDNSDLTKEQTIQLVIDIAKGVAK